MKTKITSILAIVAVSASMFAQSQDHRWSVGVNGGLSDFIGDANGHQAFNINKAYRGQLGLNAFYNLNNWFSLGADYTHGRMGFWATDEESLENDYRSFRAATNQAHLALRLKLNNGTILSETAKFQPYLMFGIGGLQMGAHQDGDVEGDELQNINGQFRKTFTGTLNTGLGFNIMMTEKLGLNYNLNYAYTGRDNIDLRSNGMNDQFIIHTIGVNYSFKAKAPKMPTDNAPVAMADEDGDGVADSKDKCPGTPKGVKVDKDGCPIDSDGDGVADYLDKCPNTAKGTAVDKDGCPVIQDDVVNEIRTIAKSIFFETNSDKISDTCFVKLDRLVQILNSSAVPSNTILDIEGHTDNTGNADYNLQLSQKRADAVKTYLVSKGIVADRLKAIGFGPKQPKADNSTSEGRAQNRRVELKLHY